VAWTSDHQLTPSLSPSNPNHSSASSKLLLPPSPFQMADQDQRDDEGEANWKETLFVWTGTLSLEPGSLTRGEVPLSFDHPIHFKGSWLPSTSAATIGDPLHPASLNPPALNSADNPNTFFLSTTLAAHQTDFLVFNSFSGSYMLDNGNGHRSNKDKSHTLIISRHAAFRSTPGGPRNLRLCAARGDTQFGKFESLGFVLCDDVANCTHEGGPPLLVLARRYIPDWGLNLPGYSDGDVEDHVVQILDYQEPFDHKTFFGGKAGEWLEEHLPLEQQEGDGPEELYCDVLDNGVEDGFPARRQPVKEKKRKGGDLKGKASKK
jgi:hypothetical protein